MPYSGNSDTVAGGRYIFASDSRQISPELEADVVDALRQVDDPELGVNIVDLGLVTACEAVGNEVSIILIMTTPTCPLGSLIAETAAAAVGQRLGPDYTIHARIDRKAVWSPGLAAPWVRARFERKPIRLVSMVRVWFSRLAGAR
ncbi:MAG: hypothetical protein B7Y12_04670 [Rhizobiales bacterium 24-66-13]|jgi:metal-sulfur cluster biosynthetic enzyme|nr:MAG: hypothetical protein B7Y95_02835 [Rhizobiales bacterium 32-66-11]OYY88648.1 MAG: hypothetical protein B7Y61_01585 [Rhizobiales bacterium 35-66-30]OYZ82164.1 MAG: hypothetical protein B7Y12_04670 [Rhizobiales bacterium 24-66-13]OZB04784.1 MAG: hypothetical protein B7X67_13420 [Rhizobiales bacterium 39-66-18]